MRSILKALGVTIWGTIAFGLLIVFLLVGYRAGMRYRNAGPQPLETTVSGAQPAGSKFVDQSSSDSTSLPSGGKGNSTPATNPMTIDAARTQFHEAADQQHYGAVLAYGKQLLDSGNAGPDDLRIIAQAHYSTRGCADALTWIDEAIDAFRAANRDPDAYLQQIKTRCEPAIGDRRISPEQKERTMRLLNVLRNRAEADRKNLPQLEEEAAKNTAGNLDVSLGEVYFGLGDYQHAIAAIQRGLEKGQVRHLDDAYVYLGRSQVAVKNYTEARLAFNKLKDVPDVSPRVLRLWDLYAETLK